MALGIFFLLQWAFLNLGAKTSRSDATAYLTCLAWRPGPGSFDVLYFFQGKEQSGARGQRHAQKEQEGPRLGEDSALLELLLCLLPFAVGWAS